MTAIDRLRELELLPEDWRTMGLREREQALAAVAVEQAENYNTACADLILVRSQLGREQARRTDEAEHQLRRLQNRDADADVLIATQEKLDRIVQCHIYPLTVVATDAETGVVGPHVIDGMDAAEALAVIHDSPVSPVYGRAIANARGPCGECRYWGASEVDPSGKEWCGRGVTWGEYELNVPADFGCSLFERRSCEFCTEGTP